MSRKNPGVTLAAFFALALGIGGATAIFSVVSAVVLRPLPIRDGNRVVLVFSTDLRGNEDAVSMADYLDWKHQLRTFSALALFGTSQATLTGSSSPERVVVGKAEWNLFSLLGISAVRGRVFQPEDNQPGHNDEVLLSWPFWQAHFGGRSNAVGNTLVLDEKIYRIAGVLPKSMAFFGRRDIWLPISFDREAQENKRGYHAYSVLGRLASGFTLAQANSDLAAAANELAKTYPKQDEGVGARAVPLRDSLSGEGVGAAANLRPVLEMLLGAIGSVLLIACGNIANLNLVRARARELEIAVRLAHGATPALIVRQLLTESITLSFAGACAGTVLAAALMKWFRALPITAIPRLEDVSLDWRVLCFAVSLGLATGVAFGLAPALHMSRVNLNRSLRGGSGRTTALRSHTRLRNLFVAVQACFAATLLILSGLFFESFLKAARVDPNFATDHLLTVYLSLPSSRYNYHERGTVERLVSALLTRVRATPGVLSAGVASDLPLTGTAGGGGIIVQGREQPRELWNSPYVLINIVSRRYFEAMKIPILRGEDFPDDVSDPKVVLINRALAREFFGRANPIGKLVSISSQEPDWRRIIGVVADVPQSALEKKPEPELFFPLINTDTPWLALAVRTGSDPGRMIRSIQTETAQVDPNVAVFLPRTMEQIIEKHLLWRKLQTWLITAFAALALILASMGVYAVVAYSVKQRIREIGVRIALGAPPGQIVWLILREGTTPALIGIAAGILGALAAERLTEQFLFGVTATDPATYAAVTLVLILAALSAAYFPARAASKIAPWKALRHE